MITDIRWVSHSIVHEDEHVQGYTLEVRVHDGKEESDWIKVRAQDRYRGRVVPYLLGKIDVEELT